MQPIALLTSLCFLADTACPRGYARMKGVTCEGKGCKKLFFIGNTVIVYLLLSHIFESGSLLESLQHVTLTLRNPELDAELQVWAHQC